METSQRNNANMIKLNGKLLMKIFISYVRYKNTCAKLCSIDALSPAAGMHCIDEDRIVELERQ